MFHLLKNSKNTHYFVNNFFRSNISPVTHSINSNMEDKLKKLENNRLYGQAGDEFLNLQLLVKFLTEYTVGNKFLKYETILRHPSTIKDIQREIHTVDWYKKILTWENIRKSNISRPPIILTVNSGSFMQNSYLTISVFIDSDFN